MFSLLSHPSVKMEALYLSLLTSVILTPVLGTHIPDHPPFDLDSALDSLWPLITPLYGVSTPCLEQSLEYIQALTSLGQNNSGDGTWALQMLDSSGRLPQEGMLSETIDLPLCSLVQILIPNTKYPQALEAQTLKFPVGHAIDSGNYDGCLRIKHGNIKGKHCIVVVASELFSQEKKVPTNTDNTSGQFLQQLQLQEFLKAEFLQFNVQNLSKSSLDHPLR